MKKRSIVLLVLMAMLFAIPAYAESSRAIDYFTDIEFDGTEATCITQITGDRVTDSITATMTLKRGNRVINSWSGSGNGILSMRGIADVSRRVTYTLVLEWTVNGVAKTPVTIQKTNN
ncbi:MAG: hypothetical protein IKK00_07660 [Oscillospiraceae bacterium]|nr:hypothetical protein [Oscillospiraceae bacterium]